MATTAILLTPDDFVDNEYALATSIATKKVLQSYIDKYERVTLYKLLGQQLADLFILNCQAAKTVLSAGPLVIGTSYYINNFIPGDDFTNVGAASNASGVYFVATGTTPAVWTTSELIANRVKRYDDILNPFYLQATSSNSFFLLEECPVYLNSHGIKNMLQIVVYYYYLAKEQLQSSQSGVALEAVENGTVQSPQNAARKGAQKWNTDGLDTWYAVRWVCKYQFTSVYPEYAGIQEQVKTSGIL